MRIPKAVLKAVWERAGGLCEYCRTRGNWLGLAPHHNPPTKMGGTKHVYTAEEIELLCYPCHDEGHGHRVARPT